MLMPVLIPVRRAFGTSTRRHPFCYDFLIKAFLMLKGPKGLPLRNIPVIHALLCLNMVDVGLLNSPPRVLNPVNYALFHFQLPPFDAGRITRATRFLFIPIAFPVFCQSHPDVSPPSIKSLQLTWLIVMSLSRRSLLSEKAAVGVRLFLLRTHHCFPVMWDELT